MTGSVLSENLVSYLLTRSFLTVTHGFLTVTHGFLTVTHGFLTVTHEFSTNKQEISCYLSRSFLHMDWKFSTCMDGRVEEKDTSTMAESIKY